MSEGISRYSNVDDLEQEIIPDLLNIIKIVFTNDYRYMLVSLDSQKRVENKSI